MLPASYASAKRTTSAVVTTAIRKLTPSTKTPLFGLTIEAPTMKSLLISIGTSITHDSNVWSGAK